MTSRSLGHRAPLLWVILPLIAGLAVAKALDLTAVGWPLVGAGGGALASFVAARRSSRIWAPAFVGSLFLAGLAAYPLHRNRLPVWDPLPAREAHLTLRIDRVFAVGETRRAVGLATVINAPLHLRDLIGQRVSYALSLGPGDRAPIRSTEVAVVGVLTALPRQPPADSFEGYLAGAGVNFRLGRGRLLAENQPPSAYRRFCADAAAWCRVQLGTGIAEKRPGLAGLLRAMMLGETHELSPEQQTVFMQSGTMHLFAISGLNIAVIAQALQALLLLARVPSWARFLLGGALLWLFVDITGAAPSAVRAFLMAALLQAAFVWQRPCNLLAAVSASALAVLLVSPLQIFSASFLMSYVIVFALLVLGLPLAERWIEAWSANPAGPAAAWPSRGLALSGRGLAQAMAIGVATSLASLVTGVQFFRLLTPGALGANLLLIPAAGLVTLAGFGSLLCAGLHFSAGVVLCNHAAGLVLLVIENFVQASVRIPGVFVAARFAWSWVGPVTLALLVTTLLWGYGTNWRPARGGWWPPFVVVGMALAFGLKLGG